MNAIKKLFSGTHRVVPDFFVIGAQKAGSTALYEYLKKHPAIIACNIKEHHFFSCDNRYEQGFEFYRSLFPQKTRGKLTFDASPSYLHNEKACERIWKYNPQAKIIILLRDPVKRAYSAWNMYRKRYMENREWFFDNWLNYCSQDNVSYRRRTDAQLYDFRAYIEAEMQADKCSNEIFEAPIVPLGRYYHQVVRYQQRFPRENILIIESESFYNQTAARMNQVFCFLGLPPVIGNDIDMAPIFVGEYDQSIDNEAMEILAKYYSRDNEELFCLIGNRFQWEGVE